MHDSWQDVCTERLLSGTVPAAKRERNEAALAAFLQRRSAKRRRLEAETEDHDVDCLMRAFGHDLRHWVTEKSWSVCRSCHSLVLEMLQTRALGSREHERVVDTCATCRGCYRAPTWVEIPVLLRHLTRGDVEVLRPISVHQGSYLKPHSAGYRRHAELTKLRWKCTSVATNISLIANPEDQARCQNAYMYLQSRGDSSYKKWCAEHTAQLSQGHGGKALSWIRMLEPCLEACLWPNLYWKDSICDSRFRGDSLKTSCRKSFMAKLTSGILDYSMSYELLQFMYDMHLLAHLSGKLYGVQRLGVSFKHALKDVSETEQYLYVRRCAMIDLMRQHGPPDGMYTVAPGIFSFEYHPAIWDSLLKTGNYLGSDCCLDALHVCHVLDNYLKRYVLGNGMPFHTPLSNLPLYSSVLRQMCLRAWALRLEIQQGSNDKSKPYHGTGVLHAHLVVWLKQPERSSLLRCLRADWAWGDTMLHGTVAEHQQSTEDDTPVWEGLSMWATTSSEHRRHLVLRHPEDASGNPAIRPYLATAAYAHVGHQDWSQLRHAEESMDYISKLCRYSTKSEHSWFLVDAGNGLAAARSFLAATRPSVAQMLLTLNGPGSLRLSHNLKELYLDPPDELQDNKVFHKYAAWGAEEMKLTGHPCPSRTLVEWMREFRTDVDVPRPYVRQKQGVAAVAVMYTGVHSDVFCGQWLVANTAFVNAKDLQPRSCKKVPHTSRWLEACCALHPELWTNNTSLNDMLMKEGVPKSKRAVILHMWAARRHLNSLVKTNQVVRQGPYTPGHSDVSLVAEQRLCLERLVSAFACHLDGTLHSRPWVRILGPPGSGKSEVGNAFTEYVLKEKHTVRILSPTGCLAEVYRQRNLQKTGVTVDTFDGGLGFFNDSQKVSVYESVIIVDEYPYLAWNRLEHLYKVCEASAFHSFVLLIGDRLQLTGPGASQDPSFWYGDWHIVMELKEIHRSQDARFTNDQMYLRRGRGIASVRDRLVEQRVLFRTENEVTAAGLLAHFRQFPTCVAMAVTRKCVAWLNAFIVEALFAQQPCLGEVMTDTRSQQRLCLYRDLRVMMTYNQDKTAGAVNGAFGYVLAVRPGMVALQLDTRPEPYAVHWQQMKHEKEKYYGFPLTVGYACTVSKMLGRTLDSVLIYPDICAPGTGYTAISRVRRRRDLWWVVPPACDFFLPQQTD